MQEEIMGRGVELESAQVFLGRLAAGRSVLLIEGEPGIGKTALWLQVVRAAETRGHRVLQARPAESELSLSFAAIADLVGAAFDETRAKLPVPQERALATALLRVDGEEAAEPRTTATALVGVLTALAEEQPVVAAIDDVQWLDSASERVLAFAVRRLPERFGLLVTRRGDGGEELPLGLAGALPGELVQRLVPGPLSLASLAQMFGSRLGMSFPRPLLTRIADASGGNPFFALEIARATARGDRVVSLDTPLAIPRRLEELIAERVRMLSGPARRAVTVAAFLSRPTASAIVEAVGPQVDGWSALGEAEEAGVVVAQRDRLRFAHPLLASVVYGSTSPRERLQLHRRLAELISDPEERARHLAASAAEPDEAIAAEVARGARRAARLGAQDAAAELFDAACRLTPSGRPDELAGRLTGQAAALLSVGDLGAARTRVEQAVATPCAPHVRAEALWVLAGVDWDAGAMRAACARLERARAEASGDERLQGRILARLALMSVPLDPRRAVEHAAAAMRLLREEEEPQLLAGVLIDRFWAEVLLGRDPPLGLFAKGLELERADPPHPVPLIWFQSVDAVDEARVRFAAEDQWYREHGEERLRGNRLGYLSLVDLRAGRWELAAQHAERSCETTGQLLVSGPVAIPFGFRSLVDAHRGNIDRARSTLLPLIAETERADKPWWAAILLSALGFVEFAAGEHAAADRALTRMRTWASSIGAIDAPFDRSEPFHVEALLALGERDRAREVLARLEQRHRALPRLWTATTLPRARALLLAAEGNVTGALDALEELDPASASRLPFELAWAQLVKGRLYRRANRKLLAAEALGQALAGFEGLGAPAWAKQARAELARVGLRHGSRDELTESEQRVAQLAASGLTNREVAQAAFMSHKTVEANLARVYRKLGIRSRAELGARMHEREGQT